MIRKTIAALCLTMCVLAPSRQVLAEKGPTLHTSSGTVEIKRDGHGIPHIYSETVYGLFYGYGYAAAQDRLFQLEMLRRAATGTASEVLGPDLVPVDELARTELDPVSISRQLEKLPAEHRQALEGYAAGFSRWVSEVDAAPDQFLPKEFYDLEFRPVAWTAVDVAMVFSASLLHRFSGPNQELENLDYLHELQRLHGPDKAWQIFRAVHWLNDPTAYTTAPADQWQYRPALPEPETLSELQQKLAKGAARPLPTLGSLDQSMARKAGRTLHEQARHMLAMNGISGRGGFESESNIWLINGPRARETSGILVNGPQFGWTSPSYAYGIGLHGAGFDVVGNTYLAVPAVLFGHNGTVGWGSTAGLTDLVDLFEEKLNPIDPDLYYHKGEWKRFDVRREIIRIKGQAPREFVRREGVHGPIVAHDTAKGVAYAKKRAWDGYELETLSAWLDLPKAKDHTAWKQVVERIAVNVNFYYLDASGNIAYHLGGRYPVRVPDHDLRLPAVGTGEMDWTGIASPDANPAAYNPKSGFLVNWNNKPGAGWPNGDQWWSMWGGAHHVRVLADKLSDTESFTPKEAWDLIRYSSHADHNLAYFLPYLRKALEGSASPNAREALRILEEWDGQWRDDNSDGIYDGPAPAIMEAFVSRLFRAVIADDVGDRNFARFAATSYPVREIPVGADLPPGTRVLVRNLSGLEGSTPLAYDFFNGEDPLAVFHRVFEETVAALGHQMGPEPDTWQIAAFKPRYAVTSHMGVRFGSETERQITAFQNRGAMNAMFWADNGRLKGVAIATPGQSGFTAADGRQSRHYQDQQSLYDKYEWLTLPFTNQEVDTQTISAHELRY